MDKHRRIITTILMIVAATIVGGIFTLVYLDEKARRELRDRCDAEDKNWLTQSGIYGEHTVIRMQHDRNTAGTLRGSAGGSLFFFSASIDGSLKEGATIQFFWEPKPGEMVVSTIPYPKLRLIIAADKITPTAKFVFNDYIPQEHRFFKNVNQVVENDQYIGLVEIRIARETMEREIYLPQKP